MLKIGCSYHHLILIFLLLYSELLSGQVTFVIDEIPDNTSPEDSIFISGNFEGWTGGQNNFRFIPGEGKYFYTLNELGEKSIEFKFTRGSWASVEVDQEGLQIENRTYTFSHKIDTVKIGISQWHDFTPEHSTSSKNVHLLSENYNMFPLEKKRRVWIYLPEGYETNNKSYPVLYMHDGQNLFDNSTAFSGEWEVDETLDKLQDSMGLEIIVVGIENGGVERINEYSTWNLKNYPTKAQGAQYVRFITENLKPFVDKQYRTLKEAEHTGIMGSSLGGLISFYAATEYPQVFGKSGVFSPSFPMLDEEIEINKSNPELQKLKIYFMSGGLESPDMVSKMTQISEKMIRSGLPEKNIKLRVNPDGKHNEKLWRMEFERAVIWLFEN
ncbi:alpha/beta hydrolase [Lutimonas zeaxanthinifaciens]|uniref:alpha/beta hydrolase n=1 Tax=Lutimonas zeaxanthinifaciens TaxID=3060215 RepID=UPI00265D5696|nr:alpha/beta hydrolase-fold protein [Lutimonas sp. YSD2104]WKK66213.1 alpha/beta hydrolase-fold protein [Lutimonas sp. YSD2104]